jgi:hypothetical protein
MMLIKKIQRNNEYSRNDIFHINQQRDNKILVVILLQPIIQTNEARRAGGSRRRHDDACTAPVVVQVDHCSRRSDDSPIWDRRVVFLNSKIVEELIESGKVGIGQLFCHFNILPGF